LAKFDSEISPRKESINSLKSKIIGKWIQYRGTETLEFFQEGTVVLTNTKSGFGSIAGNYSFIGDGTLKLELGGFFGMAGALVIEIYISGDKMKTVRAERDTAYYVRQK
jgi:hypothetical protein